MTDLATTPKNQILRAMEDRRETLLAMLPAQIGKERFHQIACAVVSSPEIAACTPPSVINCIAACARVGLIPDPILGHIFIIPRNTKVWRNGKEAWETQATLMPGYQGYVELARRTGCVRNVTTEVVYEGEEFARWNDENGPHLRHTPAVDRESDPTKIIACYCIAQLTGDSWPQIECMSRGDVERIKAGIRRTNKGELTLGWKQSEAEQWRKTAIRRGQKLWPKNSELTQLVAWEDAAESDAPQLLSPVEVPEFADTLGTPHRRSLIAPNAPPEEAPTPDAAAASTPAAILCDECHGQLAAGEKKCHNCGHVAGTPVTSKPTPKPGRPRRTPEPVQQAPEVAPVKNDPPEQTAAEKILGPADGTPSPEEQAKIWADDSEPKILLDYIMAAKGKGEMMQAVAHAIARHGKEGVFLKDLPVPNIRAIALDVKLAMLKH